MPRQQSTYTSWDTSGTITGRHSTRALLFDDKEEGNVSIRSRIFNKFCYYPKFWSRFGTIGQDLIVRTVPGMLDWMASQFPEVSFYVGVATESMISGVSLGGNKEDWVGAEYIYIPYRHNFFNIALLKINTNLERLAL